MHLLYFSRREYFIFVSRGILYSLLDLFDDNLLLCPFYCNGGSLIKDRIDNFLSTLGIASYL